MKKQRILALLLALAMVFALTACGGSGDSGSGNSGSGTSNTGGNSNSGGNSGGSDAQQPSGGSDTQEPSGPDDSAFIGPIYDEWSDMTDEELYELAKEEVAKNGPISVYATSSKMLKQESPWLEAYPELAIDIMDLDNDEVLEKCRLEAEAQNVKGDVLQVKDVNGDVFYDYYEMGYCSAFYPRDICAHIDEGLLKYGYPLYASQSFWYYNAEAFPDEQPVNNWWQIIEKNEDGSQKYRLFTKEIGTETAYLSLFASFIVNADQMEKAYKDLYGTDLEYTYDGSGFEFEVPEKNAGVEYMWRFSQVKMTFISDGDELVQAVHNSTRDDPALALASAGKIENREESGYNIAWLLNLEPYSALLNQENMYVVTGTKHPAGARLFIRWCTGGPDGESGGLKAFTKTGNWPVRDDVKDKKNPASLNELGAVPSDLAAINNTFRDAQDLWIYWLSISPNSR